MQDGLAELPEFRRWNYVFDNDEPVTIESFAPVATHMFCKTAPAPPAHRIRKAYASAVKAHLIKALRPDQGMVEKALRRGSQLKNVDRRQRDGLGFVDQTHAEKALTPRPSAHLWRSRRWP